MSTLEFPKTKFTPASVKPHPHWDGVQIEYKFPNGYGASVIRSEYSYGGKRGLWELAVLDSSGALDYSTPVTGDVEGHLADEDVERLLEQIAGLTA